MGLTMNERRAVSREVAKRYQVALKRRKCKILDEFIQITGYTRWYASYTLRNWDRKLVLRVKGGGRLILIGDRRKKIKKQKERVYNQKVLTALRKIWYICDCICGKRLAPYLHHIVPILERYEEIALDYETREKLLNISASTIDRLLASERKKLQLKGRSRTKPGTLLKKGIPIRTFADWDEKKPGFLEMDLVSHDGGSARGDYIQTLDMTDVMTGWTETRAVKNKAQIWTFEAIKEIRKRLSFQMMGIDSDNGGEFINAHLLRYCQAQKITFTRSRPYKKNDNCFVEQKNWSVVRRAVGYLRYDTEEELQVLNQLYEYLRLYTNFFQPVMKLVEKERIGSKVRKKYDKAKTPYERLLQSFSISAETKRKLKEEYEKLNPAELKRTITRGQKKLMDLGEEKKFYTIVKDLRYDSEEGAGKMKNRRAVENELAEVHYKG